MVLDYLLNTLQRYEKNLRYANISGIIFTFYRVNINQFLGLESEFYLNIIA